MAVYFFHIRQEKYQNMRPEGIELADLAAARKEAGMICGDMARDIVSKLGDSPEWQMEVTDQSGDVVFRLRLIAESLQHS